MSDKIYTIEELKISLYPIFLNYGVKKAVLFGSYSRGEANLKSDIDILVDSGLRGLRFVGFVEALRTTLDKNVDVLDVTHVERETEIDREIQKTGVVIYER